MKNLKKIIATILIITLTFGCIGSMGTFGTDDYDADDVFVDGTDTFVPNRIVRGGGYGLQEKEEQRFNIVDAINQTEFTDGKLFF